MRATSIAFPFEQTFRRLELEKRWWHRLCVVTFFAVLLCTAAFSAWVAYSVFAPQIAAVPDIETGFSDQPHVSSDADVHALVADADDPFAKYGGYQLNKMTLKQFGQRVKAKYPVYNDLDDEILARSVLAKYPQYNDVIKDASGTASTNAPAIRGLPPGAVVTPLHGATNANPPIDISAGLVPKQKQPIDYDALAKKYGGKSVQKPTPKSSPKCSVESHSSG